MSHRVVRWLHRITLPQFLDLLTPQQILTNEHSIKQAIQQPTGYAIYSSLLKIRDPETWQRVFEPTTTYSRLGTIIGTSQQPSQAPMNTLMWLLYRIGRGLRFMLAVPDNPDLKTYSSRHSPAPDTVTYQSSVGVLGPNIPFRPQETRESAMNAPAAIVQSSPNQIVVPHRQPRPSTQTERTPKFSTATRVNNNTASTGAALASPLNGRNTMVQRSRGYEQGSFVTVVAPSVVSKRSEKTTAGYGNGKATKKQGVRDDGTETTAWPEAEC